MQLFGWGVVWLIFSILLGFLIVLVSPLKSLMPGYTGASQRIVAQEALMRLDSLREEYNINEQYMANLQSIMGISAVKHDSAVDANGTQYSISPDSLLPRSAVESRFVQLMQDREKFNIQTRADITAEDMLLYPISADGIVAQDSRDSFVARVILPHNAVVMAPADGHVIASYFDNKHRSFVIIIQHDKGFVSRVSGLQAVAVGEGDNILGGEALSAASPSHTNRPPEISVEIWHDGLPVKPYNFIAGRKTIPKKSLN